MRDLVAFEIARLHRKAAQADRRTGLVDLSGKVKPGSQDMQARTVVLILGQTSDGQNVESPPLRWQAAGAGALKMHAVPADSEQMWMHSPSGTIGTGSVAHWGTYDQDNPPPSQSKNEAVLQFGGKAQITFASDNIKISYADDQYIEIKDKEILVRVASDGVVKLGKQVEQSQPDPVKTVTGQSDTVRAITD